MVSNSLGKKVFAHHTTQVALEGDDYFFDPMFDFDRRSYTCTFHRANPIPQSLEKSVSDLFISDETHPQETTDLALEEEFDLESQLPMGPASQTMRYRTSQKEE
jgi:hypothetical protein